MTESNHTSDFSLQTSLKPYPAMKDSGVKWLGDVPEHWEVRRLRDTADIHVSSVDKHVKDGETPVQLCNYVDVYKNEHICERLSFMRATATSEEIERFRLAKGDVLITKDSEAWDDIGVPALVTAPAHDLISGYHLALLRPNVHELAGAFLLRAMQSKGLAYQFHVEAKGVTRYGLSYSGIKSVRLPLPPLSEQTTIVRYLDHVDQRVRRYVWAKQKLIGLLEEQKQAIIHRAVTRGLDPDVPLKDSGVEWLGEVPEHWEVGRVKRASQILRGKFTHRPRNDPTLYDGPYPFIQTGEVARAMMTITDYRQTLNDRGLAVSKMFPAGTLVMTIAANIGDVAVLDFEACFPDSVVGFIPRKGIIRDYLYYLFRAMKPELLREAPVNTQGNLNIDRIGSRRIVMPPVAGQQNIVQYIEERTRGLNVAIDHTRREISLLREYHTRLIADVVTGKLDVREAAARLPEEDDESVELDGAINFLNDGEVLVDEMETIPEETEA